MGDSFLKLQEMCSFSKNVCIEVYGILNTRLTPHEAAQIFFVHSAERDFSFWLLIKPIL